MRSNWRLTENTSVGTEERKYRKTAEVELEKSWLTNKLSHEKRKI